MVREWNGSLVHYSEYEAKTTTTNSKTSRIRSTGFTKYQEYKEMILHN